METDENFLELKVDLAQRLLASENEAMVKKIAELMTQANDWWDELSPEEKSGIEEAEADIAAGRIYSTEEVMRSAKPWQR